MSDDRNVREVASGRISENAIGAVDSCSCGSVQLHLGSLTLRLSARDFEQLHLLVNTARSSIERHRRRQAALLSLSGERGQA